MQRLKDIIGDVWDIKAQYSYYLNCYGESERERIGIEHIAYARGTKGDIKRHYQKHSPEKIRVGGKLFGVNKIIIDELPLNYDAEVINISRKNGENNKPTRS